HQAGGLSFELGRKGTTLLGHQTPLYGEHSRPKWVSGISRPLHRGYFYWSKNKFRGVILRGYVFERDNQGAA
ncbi:hypothetical protein, partial [Pseudomonas oryzihabitans]|uniref:hypothetical protein n=1 Tax=Pseudomonas oryzihabitans TaxID=47885 RepID=UPI001C611FDA